MKKRISILLSFSLFLSCIQPIHATELEPPTEEEQTIVEASTEQKEEEAVKEIEEQHENKSNTYSSKKKKTVDTVGKSNDELFAEYVDQTFSNEITTENEPCLDGSDYKDFSSNSLDIYRQLYYFIRDVANGARSSTQLTIDFSNYDFAFNCEEESEEALGSINDYIYDDLELVKIIQVLLADCPYEFYWFDKTEGWWTEFNYNFDYYASYLEVTEFIFHFSPSLDFTLGNVDDCKVNTKKTGAAKKSASNALKVVEDGYGLSDYDKLMFYSNTILDLVDYNYDAIENSYTGGYGNPWQLIYVFDGDDSTDVVCEGYSKAFQYLFDTSSFTHNIKCRTVSGDMNENIGGNGPHMWNIVTMEDGNNYLVDITNSENSNSKRPDLFLKGGIYNRYYDSYYVSAEDFSLWYRYNSNTKNVYSDSELDLSRNDYIIPTISLSKEKCILEIGETVKINATSDVSDVYFIWESLDPSIAEISSPGTIRAKRNGQTTVQVSTSSGGMAEIEVIVQNAVDFYGTNMTLSNDITMNYYVRIIDSLKNNTTAFMQFKKPNNAYVKMNLKDAEQVNIDGEELLKFPIGISPKDLSGVLYFSYYKDYRTWKWTKDFELESYLYEVYDSYNASSASEDKMIANIADTLLKYGYFAQTYFQYKLDDLPNYYKDLSSASFLNYKYQLNDSNKSLEFIGAKLILGYTASIKLYFRTNGNLDFLYVDGVQTVFNSEGQYKYIVIPDIRDFSKIFNITASNFSLRYGIYSYGYSASTQNITDLSNLIQAMYEYNNAVTLYMNS